ncbi:MAG: O-antigen ligase family protein [Bacteroidales bacterium]|nr:O-antigen ligase family protein [Bacteroidales bacterium]
MNGIIQILLKLFYPFYPFWIWFVYTFAGQNFDYYYGAIWLPIVFYLLLTKRNRMPLYLLLFMGFTVFHLLSIFINDIKPGDINWLLYFMSDRAVVACALFFVIENTHFDQKFIKSLSRNIFIVVGISLVVSIIQTRDPYFFFNLNADKEMTYFDQNRVFSIYSWVDLNSLGITFPFLLSISMNVYDLKHKLFALNIISGIIVAFLTRARYVMISTIIVFSQLFFNSAIKLKKKVIITIILVGSVILIIQVAENYGFDFNQVIEERILEKDTDMGSAKARLLSYYVFMMKFPENPWFGVGPETRDDVIQLLGGDAPLIHVGYLSYLYFYGIVGCLFIFSAIFLLMRSSWIIGKKYGFWGPFYGFLGFSLANWTFVYFNMSEMGIVISVIFLRYYFDNPPEQEDENEVLAESETIS